MFITSKSAASTYLKVLRPLAVAFLFIAAIEIGLTTVEGEYDTNLFDLFPMSIEPPQKYILYEKYIRTLAKDSADVVQVGDSSGLFGAHPLVIQEALDGHTYLNLSCCADAGWRGYYYEAQAALRRVPKPKMLVLHVTPLWGPTRADVAGENALATAIRHHILHDPWWYKYTPPSQALRLRVINFVFKGEWKDSPPAVMGNGIPMEEWRLSFASTHGWAPVRATKSDIEDRECRLDKEYTLPGNQLFSEVKTQDLYESLKDFAVLSRQSGVRLAIVTNPVGCQVTPAVRQSPAYQQLSRFQAEFPDVLVPFEFARTWDRACFNDPYHLEEECARVHSRLIGEALAPALRQ